ncbi:MAG: class I mannose-6-phosphate isomerase [Erysipelotrichaceae bacterium]|jgi:mannose-6-phosphate isomerase|nr:class I mannose-6-phosphate isomerase [Erysipelotrichaceae bacterium]
MYRLKPANQHYLWGGDNLIKDYHKVSDRLPLAETWELSTHPDGESMIEGIPLSEFLKQQGPDFLGKALKNQSDIPLLIKFIDGNAQLSIQVHPGEEYAKLHEHDHGKTEMWIVLMAKPDSFIYFGLNRDMSKAELKAQLDQGILTQSLNRVPVKAGDVFFIEAGVIHAIGAGIVVLEIQQRSNVTYRLDDFKRPDASGKLRPLHIKQAVEVSKLTKTDPSQSVLQPLDDGTGGWLLKSCAYFTVKKYCFDSELELPVNPESFQCLTLVEGAAKITSNNNKLSLLKGDSVLLKAGEGPVSLWGSGELIVTSL